MTTNLHFMANINNQVRPMTLRNIIAVIVLISSFSTQAQVDGVDYEWTQERDKDGISIYTSNVAGSPFKAVRGIMTVKGTINSLVALVEDMPRCPDWADLCREARLEKRLSATESYAYIYNDVPFPVKDRDVYAHIVWTIDEASGRVSMTSVATKGGTEKTKAVRIEQAISQWHFTLQEDATVLVENFAHIDPNGPTPAWVTNMMLISSPFKSMQKMRELIEAGEYVDAKVAFLIKEEAKEEVVE